MILNRIRSLLGVKEELPASARPRLTAEEVYGPIIKTQQCFCGKFNLLGYPDTRRGVHQSSITDSDNRSEHTRERCGLQPS